MNKKNIIDKLTECIKMVEECCQDTSPAAPANDHEFAERVSKLWKYAKEHGLSAEKWEGIVLALGITNSKNVNEQQYMALRTEVLTAVGVKP